jgi:hypothetical protein
MLIGSCVLFIWVSSLAACGESRSTAQRPDASDTPLDAAPDANRPANCAAGRVIHLDVHPVVPGAAIPNGHLVVVFYQFNDDIQPPPPNVIGYDRPFLGTSTGYDLPLEEIVMPAPLDDYQLCSRTCKDLADAACDCPVTEAKLALANVFVVRDEDGSGAIERSEITNENIFGIGYLQLGAADRAYPPPSTLDFLVPSGVQACLAPYSILPPPGGSGFNDLGTPAATATFSLDVCVPSDPSCRLLHRANLS